MPITIKELRTEFTGRTTNLEKGVRRAIASIRSYSRKINASMEKARRAINQTGTAILRTARRISIAITAIGAAYAGATAYFVKAASDAEEVRAKFKTVFRGIEGETERWVKHFADRFGLAYTAVRQWMAGLQDTFVPLGYTRERAAQLSKQITELAADLASFNNMPTADVIRDITSALVGNHETVRKFGVILTETSLKQYAYERGIASVNSDLTNQEKVMARIAILMDQTKDAQGDLARTSDSFANTLRRLGGQWQNLREAIGEILKPDVKAWLITLIGLIRENGEAIKNAIQDVQDRLRTALVNILDWVLQLERKGALGRWFANIKNGFLGIALAAQAAYQGVKASMGAIIAQVEWATKKLGGLNRKTETWAELTAPLSAKAGAQYSAMIAAGLLPESPATAKKRAVTKEDAKAWLARRGYDVDALIAAAREGAGNLVTEIKGQRKRIFDEWDKMPFFGDAKLIDEPAMRDFTAGMDAIVEAYNKTLDKVILPEETDRRILGRLGDLVRKLRGALRLQLVEETTRNLFSALDKKLAEAKKWRGMRRAVEAVKGAGEALGTSMGESFGKEMCEKASNALNELRREISFQLSTAEDLERRAQEAEADPRFYSKQLYRRGRPLYAVTASRGEEEAKRLRKQAAEARKKATDMTLLIDKLQAAVVRVSGTPLKLDHNLGEVEKKARDAVAVVRELIRLLGGGAGLNTGALKSAVSRVRGTAGAGDSTTAPGKSAINSYRSGDITFNNSFPALSEELVKQVLIPQLQRAARQSMAPLGLAR